MFRKTLLLTAVLGLVGGLRADVKPHVLFADHAVLQQGNKVPVWGTADDGEKVTVRFQGQEASATATGGKWQVCLEGLKAGGPFELTIEGKNKITLKDILVGEVWIASGQSNMEWSVNASADPKETIAKSENANLRLFTVPKVGAEKPAATVNGKWSTCGPQSVGGFSAVAYHFGRHLQKSLEVPVGMIHTSWGGTPAEAWTRREALAAEADLRHYVEGTEKRMENYAKQQEQFKEAQAKHKEAMAKHEEAVKKAKDDGKDPPKPPVAPRAPQHPLTGAGSPGALYNGMIAPLIPYAIKGAIWYQGESNAGRAYEYRTLFATMVQNWRADWKQGDDFPFLFVQLAPFMQIAKEPTESNWAELREAQLMTLKLKNTGMAVITDVGDEKDIHPRQKEPVGQRLALAAQGIAYGKKIVYSGPTYDSLKIDGDKAVVSFKHVGGGLVAKGGPLTGFAICGADKKFVNAEAEIRDDSVVVWSQKVDKPVAVRFGWANYPVVNLWNKEGLPATPFRTDDFPGVTQPKKPATKAAAAQ